MLVLLPPSEGKSSRRRGSPVDLASLSFPQLADARARVLRAMAKASEQPNAGGVLGVGAGQAHEILRNTRWEGEPSLPVLALYSGVLYDALGYDDLPVAAKRRAASRLVVTSAAWGLLTPRDRVPPYRLSMAVTLPDVGPLAAFWRARLGPVLEDASEGHVVVDCRSATYAAAWRPRGGTAVRTVSVRVLRDVAGRRQVVSHMAKHTRGLVTRHLLLRGGRDPRTPEQVADAVAEAFEVELPAPARDGSHVLEVVVRNG